MQLKTILLAGAFALGSTFAMAQSPAATAGGGSQAGGPAASRTTTGASMNGTTTGRAMAMHRGKHMHRAHRRHHHRM